jgi:hypothetical protein
MFFPYIRQAKSRLTRNVISLPYSAVSAAKSLQLGQQPDKILS